MKFIIELLSAVTILGSGTDKTVWIDWIDELETLEMIVLFDEYVLSVMGIWKICLSKIITKMWNHIEGCLK